MEIEIVETRAFNRDGLVVIDKFGGVWLTTCKPWWHPITWMRALLIPGKRAFMILKTQHGKVRVLAIKLAGTHVQMGR